MNVYVCRRWDDVETYEWAGALIIAAHDENEALAIYKAEETGMYAEPGGIVPMEGVYAEGDPRILYDDDAR